MVPDVEISHESGEDLAERIITRRPRDMHKGIAGKVLIIAGFGGMPGAAVFTAKAALRTGSGLVYMCTGERERSVVATLVPEVVFRDWEDVISGLSGNGPSCSAEFKNAPRPPAFENQPGTLAHAPGGEKFDAVCFGPGMGTGAEAAAKLREILLKSSMPLVLDADGLNLVSASPELSGILTGYSAPVILTPHTGEALKLLGGRNYPRGIVTDDERMRAAADLVRIYHCIAVLKGAGTLVCRADFYDRGFEIWKNSTGNPGMATAGMGDILSGIILSLIGQGVSPWDSARAGVYLHGLCGDFTRDELGERGMTATDLTERLPFVIKKYEL